MVEAIGAISAIERVGRIESDVNRADPTYRFFEALLKLESTADSMMQFQMKQLEDVQEEFKALAAERLKKGEEALDQQHIADSWSLLHKAWTTIISAVSTVLGISVMATPGGMLVGGAMVSSGVLGISNLAARETGAWNWVAKQLAADNQDAQKRLAEWLPAAVDISTSVIGLLGTSSAVLEQTLNLSTGTIRAAKAVGYFGEGFASFAKGSYESEARMIQADLMELTGKVDVNQHDLERITKRIETFSEQLAAAQTQASQVVKQAMKKVKV